MTNVVRMVAANRAATIPKVTISTPITRRATRRVAALRRAAVRTLPAAASAARVLPAVARAARAVGKTALRAADRTTTIRRVTTSTRGTTRAASLPVSSVFGPTRRESPLFGKENRKVLFSFCILKFKIMHYLCMRNHRTGRSAGLKIKLK